MPDTICSECLENVDNFYSFIKNCLQNIIVLEAQYDITESCLKTKRKHEKSCTADFPAAAACDRAVQTDPARFEALDVAQFDKLTTALTNASAILGGKQTAAKPKTSRLPLVAYELNSGSDSECDTAVNPKRAAGRYFDGAENDLITEIAQRKDLKRKASEVLGNSRTKIFRMDVRSKRKSTQPKRIGSLGVAEDEVVGPPPVLTFDNLSRMCEVMENKTRINVDACSFLGDNSLAMNQVR